MLHKLTLPSLMLGINGECGEPLVATVRRLLQPLPSPHLPSVHVMPACCLLRLAVC